MRQSLFANRSKNHGRKSGLIDKVKALPADKQREALRLLDSLVMDANPQETDPDRKSIWEVIDEINANLPADTWENVQPTARSISIIIFTGHRRSSRENGVRRHTLLCRSLQS